MPQHSRSEPDLASSIAASSRSGHRRREHSHAGSRRSRHSRGSAASSQPELGMTLDQMRDRVLNSSMERYITSLQAEAQEAVKSNAWHKMKVRDGLEDERQEKIARFEMERRNQHAIRQQMEENKNIRADRRREYIDAASQHSFPLFTETFISLDEYEQYRKDQKVKFREELDEQMKTTRTMRALAEAKELVIANQKQKEGIVKLHAARGAEYNRKKAIGQSMVDSWDREVKLKNIKNAILGGKDVVRETMQAMPPSASR